jgi:pimeloyl-ACP methyl ester carboxylesterase
MDSMLVWVGAVVVALAIAAVVLLALESRQQARDLVAFPPPGRLVDVGGRRLHLVSQGEGAIPVVLVAGGGGPAVTVWPLQRRIAEFARVCSYDRAGLGWSDLSPAALSFDDQARDLRTLLAGAGEPGPYLLVGASLGGLIARAFATLFPDDVAGMVLVDAVEEQHVFAKLGRLSAGGRRQLVLMRLLAPLGLLRVLVRREARRFAPADDAAAFTALYLQPSYQDALQREVQAYALTPDARRVAGGFGSLHDLPLTVIAHDKPFPDPVIEDGWDAAQERLAALSSRGRLVVATGDGHNIAGENPALVADEVRAILETLSR